jgi:protein FAM50
LYERLKLFFRFSLQHYEIYYFIVNKTRGPNGGLLFDYSAQPTENSPAVDPDADGLADFEAPSLNVARPRPSKRRHIERRRRGGGYHHHRRHHMPPMDESLEGSRDDPTMTKVVDRRWYERNKHIFPASVWEEFDPEKDYTHTIRRDNGGNAFFFS